MQGLCYRSDCHVQRSCMGSIAWSLGLNYTLAAIKPRTEWKQGTTTTAKAKPKPLPMQDRLLIDNWQGLSKEDLLALPDFLPAGVRDCPRAYLVKPRQTNTGKKNSTFRANEKVRRAKRPRDTEDSVQRRPSNPASTYATPTHSTPAPLNSELRPYSSTRYLVEKSCH